MPVPYTSLENPSFRVGSELRDAAQEIEGQLRHPPSFERAGVSSKPTVATRTRASRAGIVPSAASMSHHTAGTGRDTIRLYGQSWNATRRETGSATFLHQSYREVLRSNFRISQTEG